MSELPELEVYVEEKDGERWRNVCVAIKDFGEIWNTDLKFYGESSRKIIVEQIEEIIRRSNAYPDQLKQKADLVLESNKLKNKIADQQVLIEKLREYINSVLAVHEDNAGIAVAAKVAEILAEKEDR